LISRKTLQLFSAENSKEDALIKILSENIENSKTKFYLYPAVTNHWFMNTLAYIIYLLLTYLITVHVGLRFYRNGRVYILNLLHGDAELTDFINRLLLAGYYLLNLGYAVIMIRFWETITSWTGLFSSICIMTGRILLTLALIHFCNMTVIYFLSHRKHFSLHHKK
jgi:hypothetical protein